MAQAVVTIAGRTYRMNCDEGEENHIEALAQMVDAKIAELRGAFGEIGDQRITVMAALTIADELSESREQVRRVEDELATLHDARTAAADHARTTERAIAAAFNAAAERIEKLAKALDARGPVAPADTGG